MSEKPYPIKSEGELIFSFTSVGPKGRMEKLVRYDEMEEGVYNLGFGDGIGDTFDIDDKSRSNNGDMKVVLSSVIETIHLFFAKIPNGIIRFKGSHEIRTSLYIRIVKTYRLEFQADFNFWGDNGLEFELFEDNKTYLSLAITKK